MARRPISVNIPFSALGIGSRGRGRGRTEAQEDLTRAQTRKSLTDTRAQQQKTSEAQGKANLQDFSEFLKAARASPDQINPRAMSLLQRGKKKGGFNEKAYRSYGWDPDGGLFFVDVFGNPAVVEKSAGRYRDPETGKMVQASTPILDPKTKQKIPIVLSKRTVETMIRQAEPETITTLSPGQEAFSSSRGLPGEQAISIARGQPKVTSVPAGAQPFVDGKRSGLPVPAKITGSGNALKQAYSGINRLMLDEITGRGVNRDLREISVKAKKIADQAFKENPGAGAGVILDKALEGSGYYDYIRGGGIASNTEERSDDPNWFIKLMRDIKNVFSSGTQAVATPPPAAQGRLSEVQQAERFLRGGREGGRVKYAHGGRVMAAHGGENPQISTLPTPAAAPQAPAAANPAPGFLPAVRSSTGTPTAAPRLRPSGGATAPPAGGFGVGTAARAGLGVAAGASGNPVVQRLAQLGFARPQARQIAGANPEVAGRLQGAAAPPPALPAPPIVPTPTVARPPAPVALEPKAPAAPAPPEFSLGRSLGTPGSFVVNFTGNASVEETIRRMEKFPEVSTVSPNGYSYSQGAGTGPSFAPGQMLVQFIPGTSQQRMEEILSELASTFGPSAVFPGGTSRDLVPYPLNQPTPAPINIDSFGPYGTGYVPRPGAPTGPLPLPGTPQLALNLDPALKFRYRGDL